MAYQALMSAGPLERALYGMIGRYGLTATADRLGRDPDEVKRWILAGRVPADVTGLCKARAVRRGPLPGGAQDPRRARLPEVAGLSVRQAALVLGVARDTVMRWRLDAQRAA